MSVRGSLNLEAAKELASDLSGKALLTIRDPLFGQDYVSSSIEEALKG